MRRGVRVGLQLAASAAIIAYLLWQVDVGETLDHIASSDPLYLLAALAIVVFTIPAFAWRWGVLLASKGIHEPLGWLTKMYFVGYSASQVLPTTVGGDAVRIIEHARRRPDAKGEAAGAVLMERAIGSAATLVLVAVGLALAVGRYENIELLVEIELASLALVVLFGILVFSRRTNAFLQERVFPQGRGLRLQRPLSALWSALHGYREQRGALALVLSVSVVLQLIRIVAIWCCGEAVGLDLSLLVYIVFGPLLFLVMMVPITLNGLGVRESFFVFFLGRFDVDADAAFAAGFLFFAVTILAAIPGALIVAWGAIRGGVAPASRSERARARP
jgi:glycosyltransferase 2 family protein